jgi:hypothetical protein
MSAVPTTAAGKKKLIVKTTVYSYTLLIRHLTLHDSTVAQLLEVTGLHRQTVGNILRAFHKLDVIHITNWLPDGTGRQQTPIYRWGVGIDVKRRVLTGAERQQRQRDKRKKERDLARRRSLNAIEKGLKSELAKLANPEKQEPATSAGLGYSIFVQVAIEPDGHSS